MVGQQLQESTVPQIRDKAGLAPRIYDLVFVSVVLKGMGNKRRIEPATGESTID